MADARPNRPLGRLRLRAAALIAGLAALAVYLAPRLPDPGAHWPLWDVNVYWWGGAQVLRGAAVYAKAAPYHFTYPPFMAALFGSGAIVPEIYLKVAISVASVCALAALSWLALGAAGVRRRPELVFAVAALALLTTPVSLTLRLGETDLIVVSLVCADLLGRRDGGRWQGVGIGLAAAIKLTPLIFIPYLLLTRRVRAAAVAVGAFAATVALGFALLPSDSRTYWLSGEFLRSRRIGNPINPDNQSLAGAAARLAGGHGPAMPWWLAAAVLIAVAGLAVAVWAHRRGHRLAGAVCCGITALLVSPMSWTHHWVWVVPLLVALGVAAWRRRSAWYAAAAAAVAYVFWPGAVPLPWPGRDPDLGGLLTGDAYVLCGLAVIVAAAVALVLERTALARPLGRVVRSAGSTVAATEPPAPQ